MRHLNNRLTLFGLVCLVQLAVPASMIAKHERTLASGTLHRFRTAPVDPYDPFRGRYVRIRVSNMTVVVDSGSGFRAGQKVYALLQRKGDGFDRIVRVLQQRPESSDYLQVEVVEIGNKQIEVLLPFDRYYLEENVAPLAERAYGEQAGADQSENYVTVRILDGHHVVQGLYADGVPIEQMARRKQKEGG